MSQKSYVDAIKCLAEIVNDNVLNSLYGFDLYHTLYVNVWRKYQVLNKQSLNYSLLHFGKCQFALFPSKPLNKFWSKMHLS